MKPNVKDIPAPLEVCDRYYDASTRNWCLRWTLEAPRQVTLLHRSEWVAYWKLHTTFDVIYSAIKNYPHHKLGSVITDANEGQSFVFSIGGGKYPLPKGIYRNMY